MYPDKKMPDNDTSANELRAILNEVSDGIAMLNKDGEVKWGNIVFNQLAALAGYVSGLDPLQLIGAATGVNLQYEAGQVVLSQVAATYELFFYPATQWFLVHITPDQDGAVLRFEDITIQKELNEEVLIDERNLRILVNITDHPIWLVDVNCNIVLCNDAFKKWIFDFSGKVLGTGDNVLSEDLDNTYLDKIKACYLLALEGNNFTAIEDIKIKDEIKFTTINFNPVFDKNAVLVGISCHATDITDHKKNLTKIEAQTQLLLEIANIQSHKVRGPVATLLGLIEVFNFDDATDPNNIEVMNGVADVTEKLDEIVTNVIRSINLLSYRSSRK